MIRIDELYNNTIWPWMQANRPGIKMFFCDPFGRSDPDSLFNFGYDDSPESSYIFFFDQEPIHLNIHVPTFDEVVRRNTDVAWPAQTPGAICTSERDSDNVDELCKKYNWKS